MALRITRDKNMRHWALGDDVALVAVTVYKRGAEAVQRRLAALPPSPAAAAAAPEAREPGRLGESRPRRRRNSHRRPTRGRGVLPAPEAGRRRQACSRQAYGGVY